MKRTIMIFPQFENMNIIEQIRSKYDPLAQYVRPHITLVFPFECNLTVDELRNHLNCVLSDFEPFELSMEKVVKIDNQLGKYLFLLIDKGIDQVKKISAGLYTGALEPHKPVWLNESSYLPHMTLGCFQSKEDLAHAFDDVFMQDMRFATVVDKISVEIIDENEYSVVDIEVELHK